MKSAVWMMLGMMILGTSAFASDDVISCSIIKKAHDSNAPLVVALNLDEAAQIEGKSSKIFDGSDDQANYQAVILDNDDSSAALTIILKSGAGISTNASFDKSGTADLSFTNSKGDQISVACTKIEVQVQVK